MEEWRGKSAYELRSMEDRLRCVMEQRGIEMRSLLMEIVEMIDTGRFGDPETGMLIDSIKYYARSREDNLAAITFCRGNARRDRGDNNVAG